MNSLVSSPPSFFGSALASYASTLPFVPIDVSFNVRMSFGTMSPTRTFPPTHVYKVSNRLKMALSNTKSYVAEMIKFQSHWYRTISYFMSKHGFLMINQSAIAIFARRACPQPTWPKTGIPLRNRPIFVNFGPEKFGSILRRHLNFLSGDAGPDVHSVAASPIIAGAS